VRLGYCKLSKPGLVPLKRITGRISILDGPNLGPEVSPRCLIEISG
jgi:hypothetical protein